MTDFLIALGGFSVVVAVICFLEWRSHPRDRRSAALRRANEPPLEGEKK